MNLEEARRRFPDLTSPEISKALEEWKTRFDKAWSRIEEATKRAADEAKKTDRVLVGDTPW